MSDENIDMEQRFRKYNGDELTNKILLHTSQMYDHPFWLREQTACYERPDIAYEVAWNLENDRKPSKTHS